MTSTWMEDYVFDEVNDYIFYLYSLFSSLFSTSFTSTYNYDPYANCLYNHMLEKQYGAGIIKDIWDFIIHENVLDAINHELTNRNSSFAQSQNQYAGWLYFTGRRALPNVYFSEGNLYPEVIPDQGLESFDKGIIGRGMRLIALDTTIIGYVNTIVESPDFGKFSHIINEQTLTKPADFNSRALIRFNKDDNMIVVLSNPDENKVTDIRYKIYDAQVVTGENPVTIESRSDNLIFSNVPQNAVIRIFNILGQKIKTLHSREGDQVQWNYRGQSGNRIATGMYIFYVKAGGYEYAAKLTILK
ncbi:MAG: hypothetical protein P8X42_19245 [Calditrichaceae bacterium]